MKIPHGGAFPRLVGQLRRWILNSERQLFSGSRRLNRFESLGGSRKLGRDTSESDTYRIVHPRRFKLFPILILRESREHAACLKVSSGESTRRRLSSSTRVAFDVKPGDFRGYSTHAPPQQQRGICVRVPGPLTQLVFAQPNRQRSRRRERIPAGRRASA